jgi:hypothetical protein
MLLNCMTMFWIARNRKDYTVKRNVAFCFSTDYYFFQCFSMFNINQAK